MKRRTGSRAGGWLLGAMWLAASAQAGAPGPPEDATASGLAAPLLERTRPTAPPHPDAVWRSLRYEGAAVLGDFGATLALEPTTRSPVGTPRWIAELRTRMRSSLLADKETLVRAWFDPQTARVSWFEKLKLGPRPSYKRFLFEEGGARRFRKEPKGSEDPVRHETWASERESFVAFDAGQHGCRLLSDPGALVYLVSFGPGRWQEDPGACVISGKTLYRVSVAARGSQTQDVHYRVRGAAPTVRKGRVPLDRYEVVGTPVAGELTEPVTRVDILVDRENAFPWKVVVREGPFQLDVVLSEAVLGDPPELPSRE